MDALHIHSGKSRCFHYFVNQKHNCVLEKNLQIEQHRFNAIFADHLSNKPHNDVHDFLVESTAIIE